MSPRLSFAAFIALVAVAGPAHADVTVTAKPAPAVVSGQSFDAAGWTSLGRKTLTGAKRRDVVTLSGGTATLDQLTLVVDGDLDVSRITVVTAGGKRIVRRLEHRFRASAKSRQIELTGNDRALRSVQVVYDLGKAETATLTVYGRASASARTAASTVATTKRDEAPLGRTVERGADTTATRPAFSPRQGWTLLGAQTVDGRDDSDTVRVPNDAIGMFDQIGILVTGGDLELSALKLRFAGGSTAEIDHRYYFRGSERTRIIKVPGGEGSVVRMIQLRYGKDRGAGKTRIELWAR
jgi:hypothetical protein